MPQLLHEHLELFHSAIESEKLILGRQLRQGQHKREFKRYQLHLQTISQRYNPQKKIGYRDVVERFRHEAASLSSLIAIINRWLANHGLPPLASLTINGMEEFYPVSQISSVANDICCQIAAGTRDPEGLSRLLTSASNSLFERSSKYFFSEYYTPPSVAEQIVRYALASRKLSETDLPIVVDPACGNGSLLSLVATKFLYRSRHTGQSPKQILQSLLSSIHGFDIQPYSVILTRLNLLLQVVELFPEALSVATKLETLFDKIVLNDPLPMGQDFWKSGQLFDVVIANPPYGKVVNTHVPFIGDYQDVVYGHANLYQLFLWWAIKATNPGGNISFLIPQSFRSGSYFQKLRAQISETCEVRAITHIGHRTSVFEEVDQSLVCLSLQKRGGVNGSGRTTKIEIFQNGSTAHQPMLTNSFRVKTDELTRKWGNTTIWVLSENKSDYEILDKVLRICNTSFKDNRFIRVRNGGFVWNQQKPLLLERYISKSKPLISATSISPFHCKFPVSPASQNYKRQYVMANNNRNLPIYYEELLIIQRTTAQKSGRRVIGTMITDDVVALERGFFVENHVNVIQDISKNPSAKKSEMLWGLTGWANSRLLNFTFDMLNGSAHISGYELNMLPLPSELVAELAGLAKKAARPNSIYRNQSYDDVENTVLDFFHLTKPQRNRLKEKIK
ncbi:MAG: N-6 DNA methylase [Chloroflexi bacterium]|nr:N-6 DNA methylase [Chloroflexota bacterium]